MFSALRTRSVLPLPSAATRRALSISARRDSFAKMSIIGRLGATPELAATSTGREILKYTIAVSSGPRDSAKTSWFNVAGFLDEGPQRDFIAGLEKGTLVYLEARAEMNQYSDAEGKNRTALSLVQQRLEVLSPQKTSE